MQQKQRRAVAVAAVDRVDRCARSLDLLRIKSFEKLRPLTLAFCSHARVPSLPLHLSCSMVWAVDGRALNHHLNSITTSSASNVLSNAQCDRSVSRKLIEEMDEVKTFLAIVAMSRSRGADLGSPRHPRLSFSFAPAELSYSESS